MLRQLLAVLALITGLAAMVEPAQAARASVETVGESDQGSPCAVLPVILSLGRQAGGAREAREKPCRATARRVMVPAVQLQADRARE